MHPSVRQLFRELADVPQEERARFLTEHGISAELRVEVESLLRYDSTSGEPLARRVSDVVEEARPPAFILSALSCIGC